MDTDIFLARCEALDEGLHDLSNEFYASLTDGAPGKERNELIRLAKEKITLYNELYAEIKGDEQEEEEMERFIRYIDKLKRYLQEV